MALGSRDHGDDADAARGSVESRGERTGADVAPELDRPRIGVFPEFQAAFASLGIATFPMRLDDRGKRPMVRGYAKIGLRASRQLAVKYRQEDAFGFCAGELSKITVVDIDAPDEDLLHRMLERFGETPVLVSTPSGGRHLYYRWSGETRRIRPGPDPVDIIGAGVVVAPPSLSPVGRYEFVRGAVEDLARLPKMRRASEVAVPRRPRGRIGAGGREKALFDHLMRAARRCDSREDLRDVAFKFAECKLDRAAGHPFTDGEIEKKVDHVWRMTAEGRNFVGAGGVTPIPNDVVDRMGDADALFLYAKLCRNNADRAEFFVANAMAERLGWTLRRFRKARDQLVSERLLVVVSRGGRGPGDPPVFAWS